MTSPTNTRAHNICLFLLLAIASFLIFYRFPTIPINVSYDEAAFANLAMSLAKGGFHIYSPLATGHTTPYFYTILASFKLFGLSVWALRLPAAIFGVLTVIPAYNIFRLVFSQEYVEKKTKSPFLKKHDYVIPTLLTFTFISLRWYYNFARFSFEATFLLFFELVSILFFLYYKNTKQGKYLIGSGLFAGLAYNSYTPGRIFILLPLLFIFSDFTFTKKRLNGLIQHILLFAIPFAMMIAPLTIYFSQNKDIRINQLSYVTNDKMEVGEKFAFAWDSTKRAASMFHIKGDMNGRHNYPGKPAVNPIIGLLFIIGLLYAIKHIKDYRNMFFLIYFALGILPMMLTYPWESPNMLRSFTVIPSIVYFVGVALLLAYRLPLSGKKVSYALAIVLYLAAVYDARTYFLYQAYTVFPDAFEISQPLLKPYLEGMYRFVYKIDALQ